MGFKIPGTHSNQQGLYSISILLLSSISHLFHVQANTTDIIMTSCCSLGSTLFLNSSHACPPIQLELGQLHVIRSQSDLDTCKAVAHVCCLRMRQRRKCDLGKKMYLETGSCQGSQHHGDNHFECCNCCHLGFLNRQAGRVPQCLSHPEITYSSRCLETYVQCCVNGTTSSKPCPSGTTWNKALNGCETFKWKDPFRRNKTEPIDPTRTSKWPKYSVFHHSDATTTATTTATTVTERPHIPGDDGGQKVPRQSTAGFKSKCPFGFVYSPLHRRCADINECDQSPPPCHSNEECLNTIGSFRCTPKLVLCPQGFQLNRYLTDCEDINECHESPYPCYENEECENLPGTFRCVPKEVVCHPGYRVNYYSNECEDIDECADNTHRCPVTDDCVNNDGHYQCHRRACPSGYELSNVTGYCEHVHCEEGLYYEGKDRACIDIDECTLYPYLCLPGQTCVNLLKSYECRYMITCADGLELDQSNGVCQDIDECSQPDMNQCSRHSRCENTFGSYYCNCDEGFELDRYDSLTCTDIDECNTWSPCDQDCVNTIGSYECFCKTGYLLREDLRTCIDINECDTSVSGDPVCYGLCHNTIGSYMCHCPAGYNNTRDSRYCHDIDECKNDPYICGAPDDVCINTLGGYKCQTVKCPKTFNWDKGYNYKTDTKIVCKKKHPTCPFNEHDCLTIQSYSINFIVLDSGRISPPMTLHTVKMKMTSESEMRYNLEVVSAVDPNTGYEAWIDERIFYPRSLSTNSVSIELYERIEEPIDIELQLTIDLYDTNHQHKGKYISKLYLYITKHRYSFDSRHDFHH